MFCEEIRVYTDVALCHAGEHFSCDFAADGFAVQEVRQLLAYECTDALETVSRKTRKVGLGIPFLTMLAEMTGGGVTIVSKHESEGEDHGTTTSAKFNMNHIDFIPLGDMVETVKTLIQGSPDVNFTFTHKLPCGEVRLSCAELREELGDIPLNEPEILSWIGDYLQEQYESAENGTC